MRRSGSNPAQTGVISQGQKREMSDPSLRRLRRFLTLLWSILGIIFPVVDVLARTGAGKTSSATGPSAARPAEGGLAGSTPRAFDLEGLLGGRGSMSAICAKWTDKRPRCAWTSAW
jgi:hypothetical protein